MGCTAQYTHACSVGSLGTVHPGWYCRQPWHSTPRMVVQVALVQYTQACTVGGHGTVHPRMYCRWPWHSAPRPVLQVALAKGLALARDGRQEISANAYIHILFHQDGCAGLKHQESVSGSLKYRKINSIFFQFNSISFIEKGTLQRTSKYSYSYYMIMTDLNFPSGSRQGRLLLDPFNINYTVI